MDRALERSHEQGNCFDLLRLVLAGLVVWCHCSLIDGFGADWFTTASRGQVNLGMVGVCGFFGISGFLIAASYERGPSIGGFLRRRVLRIIPAFYANLLITAFVVGPLIWAIGAKQSTGYPWTGAHGAIHYVMANATLRITTWSVGMPPYPDAFNGSLWSLWPEFVCYLGVLAVGKCGLLAENRIYLLLMGAGLLVYSGIREVGTGTLYPLIPTPIALGPYQYIVAFSVGTCAWAFREHLPVDRRLALLFGILLVGLAKFGGWALGAPVLIPLFVLQIGQGYTLRFQNDFSYGVYIWHFPIAKLLVLIPSLAGSLGIFLPAVTAMTAIAAMGSWFLVERPFLRRKAPARLAASAL